MNTALAARENLAPIGPQQPRWAAGIMAAAALLSLVAAQYAASAESRRAPNIVLFLADDLGYMDVGCNNPQCFYETPNIDGLAKRGMRFTSGYAACCVCSPSRASIMTGKYPPRTGVTAWIGCRQNPATRVLTPPNADHLALEEATVAERLRDVGYATFFAGKWHLGDGEYAPAAQGFPAGLTGRGQFYYPPTNRVYKPADDPKTSDRIADAAVDFIAAHQGGPFFAYLPFLAVHMAVGARADLVDKYQKKKASAPEDAWGEERDSAVRLVQNHAAYAGMLEQMDRAIGRVLAALEKKGLAQNTIVIFTSDNGGVATRSNAPTANLPLRAGKGWPYEGGVRTPWVVVAPGVTKPGAVCDAPVITNDLYPTLLQLAGLPLMPQQHRDGVSFVPLLRGARFARGAPLFWHYPHYSPQGGAPASAIRDGDWKLIEWFENGALELFNLRNDLGEKHNLTAQEPERTRQLHQQLQAWRKSVGAALPTPNPDYKPSVGQQPVKPKKRRPIP